MKPTNKKSNESAGATRVAAERLADIFIDLQRSFAMGLSEKLSKDEVSYPQYYLLTHLDQQESMMMTEIARWMGHTTAAATGMVDRLELSGLAKRVRSKEDRRKIGVRISPKGASLVASVRKGVIADIERMLGRLGEEDADAWSRLYERLAAASSGRA